MSEVEAVKLIVFPSAEPTTLPTRAKALVFKDPQSMKLLDEIDRIARADATVLLVGETGTGKELIARRIHEHSGRSGPFIAVNCGSFSETLVEAELFGHESGAFTGAQQARAGWFEAANGGTLFLDEVGDMPLPLQVKLLRVLQERQVTRIGSRKPISLDLRLIAATNVNLNKAVKAGHFRLDLYYRLSVAPVHLPPLRQRRGDIMPLVRYFIELYRKKLNLDEITITAQAKQTLYEYDWPGNIRELENVVHYALIICQNNTLEYSDLRLPILVVEHMVSHEAKPATPKNPIRLLQDSLRKLIESDHEAIYETVERLLITTTYDHCNGNQVRSAKRLGISRNILRAQLKRFNLLEQGSQEILAEINGTSSLPNALPSSD